ncbi:phage baseplate assembly protein V [Novosphingopyxis sp. YJ-S2-01]|nr:phage baseplate assembly protein V [Novosphingopyxis sp. YJ-S2-01]
MIGIVEWFESAASPRLDPYCFRLELPLAADSDVEYSPELVTARSGATRSWSPPSLGEQVVLLCPGGDIAAAVALGSIPQDAFPPAGNSLRELIEYPDGAVIAYDSEAHKLDVTLPEGGSVAIVAGGGVTLDARQGGVTVLGDVTIDGAVTASGDIVAKGDISLADHRHGLVRGGTDKSGPPA